jgi:hypothetical protein
MIQVKEGASSRKMETKGMQVRLQRGGSRDPGAQQAHLQSDASKKESSELMTES